METDYKQLLCDSFCEIAENLAFMFGELAEEDEIADSPDACVSVEMGFVGPFTGTITMAVPVEMCAEITANVLGIDPDDDIVADKPWDALKELLNVTCGHVLTSLAGDEPIFDLTVPQVTQIDEAIWHRMRDEPGTAAFIVDENPVLLKLVVNP